MEKKYENNNILAGSRALLYNVHLDTFFKTNGEIKATYSGQITDIGFEWKLSSSQTWASASLKSSSNDYIQNLSDIQDSGNVHNNNNCMCYRYASTTKSGIYPTRVLIKNLTSGGTYTVRSYYTISGSKTYYNEQTATLITASGTISFKEPTKTSAATSNVSESDMQTFINKINQVTTAVVEIYSMFTSFSNQYSIVIDYNAQSGFVASAKKGVYKVTFNSYYRSESVNGMRSVMIHELAHVNMNNDNNSPSESYKNKIIKFMEFATNMPCARWIWQAGHNYPVISSKRYDYMDDCLVVAACELSKEMNN